MSQRIRTMKLSDAAVDALGITLSSRATPVAGAASLVASMADWNWTAIIAGLATVIGLGANLYFQVRRDRRETAESRAKIAALRERCSL
ncbi:hypothetical protein D9M72_307450 [compost metagenome]